MAKYTDRQIDAALHNELNDAMSDVIGRLIHSAIIEAVRRRLPGVSEERVRERLNELVYGGDNDYGW